MFCALTALAQAFPTWGGSTTTTRHRLPSRCESPSCLFVSAHRPRVTDSPFRAAALLRSPVPTRATITQAFLLCFVQMHNAVNNFNGGIPAEEGNLVRELF